MNGVPKLKNLKYISSFKDRHGKVRYRFRRKGYRSVYIEGELGSPEFLRAYANAQESKVVAGASKVKPMSISDLVVHYFVSYEFTSCAKSTQTVYRRILDKFRIQYGDLSVQSLKRRHIRQIMDKMSNSPTSANKLLSLLCILLDIALEKEWVEQNHARTIKKLRIPETDGFIPWSDEELKLFKKRYPSGTRERLALCLYLYTGQRGCDVAAMKRSDISGQKIRVVQQKTGKSLQIPLHPELRNELALHQDRMMLMLTEYGKPFSTKGFQQWFSKKARQAGLVNRTGHGLRKTTAKMLANAGCTPHEIQAITGHKTLSEVTRYTQAVDQEKLAEGAITSLK